MRAFPSVVAGVVDSLLPSLQAPQDLSVEVLLATDPPRLALLGDRDLFNACTLHHQVFQYDPDDAQLVMLP